MHTKLTSLLFIFLLIIPTSGAFNPMRSNKEAWTCYDHALNFSNHNPDWGLVGMSDNKLFRGETHLVNYKLLDNNTILIHDEVYGSEYDLTGWQNSGFYHFFINETPRRYYKWLIDNRELAINGL